VPDLLDRELENLLHYTEAPQAGVFVMDVMRRVRREQRTRRAILWAFGAVGALFGLAGAVMLTGPVSKLFTISLVIPVMETMQATLLIVSAAAFYLWCMNDDLSLGG
jgi:protein-S-isoprenylcysteine O-methyltransferase Ste14